MSGQPKPYPVSPLMIPTAAEAAILFPGLSDKRKREDTDDSDDDAPVRKKRRVDLRRHSWFLTWNNPPDNYAEILQNLVFHKWVFQLEKGASGTKHVQGCFTAKHAVRFSTIDNALVPKGVWKPCLNVVAARKYCSKVNFRFCRYCSFVSNILFNT